MFKRRVSWVLAFLLMIGISIAGDALTARADNKKAGELVVNIASDDAWRAATALKFCDGAQRTGHHVTILLTAQAVRWADAKTKQDVMALNAKTNEQMLEKLISHGATVMVCPPCLKVAGVAPSDLAKGVELGKAETIFPKLFAKDVRTMSW